MGEGSKIEWTDHTFNPWIGCTKVSPGCFHCYAENSTRARVLRSGGHETWGHGAKRSRTTDDNWRKPVRWNEEAPLWMECTACRYRGPMADGCTLCGCDVVPTRPRVFCASLADWLDEEVRADWLTDLLWLVASTPNLDWQLLTKRPQNWRTRLEAALKFTYGQPTHGFITTWLKGEAPANVWVGSTAEDQTRFNERYGPLSDIPARVRFWSMEPLLGPIDFTEVHYDIVFKACFHWVICGGESGPKARPMHPRWVKDIQSQCEIQNTPFLFKQWGDWAVAMDHADGKTYDAKGARADGTIGSPFGAGTITLARVGKKKAGRLLDGVTHNGFPAIDGRVA